MRCYLVVVLIGISLIISDAEHLSCASWPSVCLLWKKSRDKPKHLWSLFCCFLSLSLIPVHLSSLIPRMSMCTLVVSCLTTSNLSWLMDLTFQVSMQYCSLQHRTLLLSPVPVLFLLWLHPFILSGIISPLISSSILGTYRPKEFPFQYSIILPFPTVHGVLKARILKWFAIPFCNGPHSVKSLHHDPPILGGPTWHGLVSLSETRLWSIWLDWLVFCDYVLCVCPLMPSHNTYRLTWVSLTLNVGYLFTAAPAKRILCSLPWTRGISSRPPLLTLNVE